MRYAVTGVTGFIATQLTAELIKAGHEVVGTLRNAGRADEVRANLRALGAEPSALVIRVADLTNPAGWTPALEGAEALFHVASPLPLTPKRRDPALVETATAGTRNVLTAAYETGIRRAVVTSSVAAIGYGHPRNGNRKFDESHWSDHASPSVGSYALSKTMAERAAWQFASEHADFEICTVNPSVVLGPLVGSDIGTSAQLVGLAMRGKIPAIPPVNFSVVDVRDVVELHLSAMRAGAAGERFIANAGELAFAELIAILRETYPSARLPKVKIPLSIARVYANLDPRARAAASELGVPRSYSSDKARQQLGWQPRSPREAVIATAAYFAEN